MAPPEKLTKQGVRDLNHLVPKRPAPAAADKAAADDKAVADEVRPDALPPAVLDGPAAAPLET